MQPTIVCCQYLKGLRGQLIHQAFVYSKVVKTLNKNIPFASLGSSAEDNVVSDVKVRGLANTEFLLNIKLYSQRGYAPGTAGAPSKRTRREQI